MPIYVLLLENYPNMKKNKSLYFVAWSGIHRKEVFEET